MIKIQEYTNKFTLLQYKAFTIKTLELPHVSTVSWGVILNECLSVSVQNIFCRTTRYKNIYVLSLRTAHKKRRNMSES